MTLDQFPAIAAHRPTQLALAIATIFKGVEDGAIANVAFKDAKDLINRALYDGWQKAVSEPFYYAGRYQSLSKPEQDLDHSAPQCHTIDSHLKKIAKTEKVREQAFGRGETQATKAMKDFLFQVKPLTDAVVSLKDKVVKRQPKADVDPYEKYRAPAASNTAIIEVKKVLTEVTEEAHAGLVAKLTKAYQYAVDAYIDAQKKAKEEKAALPHNRRFDETPSQKLAGYFFKNHSMMISHAVDLNKLVKRPNAQEVVAQYAAEMADRIRESFIYKNLIKLDSIFDAKKNFERLEVLSHGVDIGGLEATFRFFFKDGSAFTTKLQVVYVTNSYGTHFERFPITFHDVVLADGSKMKSPSEERVNTVFVGA